MRTSQAVAGTGGANREERFVVWNRNVFAVGGREYQWIDVLLAALWRGDWHPFDARLRQGLACEAYAYDIDDPADQDAVDAATTAFRYDHELLTAEETEAWLERRGLTVDSWSRVFVRTNLRERWADRLDRIVADVPITRDEILAELPAEGHCTGAFLAMARQLAARAAVAAFEAEPDAEPQLDEAQAEAVVQQHAALFDPLDPLEYERRLLHVASLEHTYTRTRNASLTPEALKAEVDASRLDWIAVDLDRLRFPERSMVREALLRCGEEGLTLAQLATRINRRVLPDCVQLDDCDDVLRQALLSAEPGQLLGPVPQADAFDTIQVRQKTLPSLDVPVIRARAEAAVEASLTHRALVRVHWHATA